MSVKKSFEKPKKVLTKGVSGGILSKHLKRECSVDARAKRKTSKKFEKVLDKRKPMCYSK